MIGWERWWLEDVLTACTWWLGAVITYAWLCHTYYTQARLLKMTTITSAVSPSRQRKNERGIWQRRYWEHQIRDERDLNAHIDDIHINPVKHGYVSHVADWPYSSFHRYVQQGLLPADWAGEAETDGSFGE